MRSTWLGLGFGILSLIGCNALWQGYLSPLDDPSRDGSVDNRDLTGVPPDDLAGADLTGVTPADLTTPARLCGFAGTPVTGRYSPYSKITAPVDAVVGSRIAAIDIDGDGLAEIAVNKNNLVKIIKLTSSLGTCTYTSTSDCNTSDPSIDVKAFQISASKATFIAARSNSNQNALSLCSGTPPYTALTLTNPAFTANSPIREINVPPLDTQTNGMFLIHEKCGAADTNGDRLIAITLNNSLAASYKAVMLKANFSGFEPLSATGARFDDTMYDGYLDFLTLELNSSSQLAYYTYASSTQTASRRGLTTGAQLGSVTAGGYDILSARLSADVYDDAIAINKGSNTVTPFIISTATGSASMKAPFTIPSGSNNRLDIAFADFDKDSIDEMIVADKSGSVNIYQYNTATNAFSASPTKLTIPGYSSDLAFAQGHLESKFAPKPPDIFVLFKNTSNQFEVGVFRFVPLGVSAQVAAAQ